MRKRRTKTAGKQWHAAVSRSFRISGRESPPVSHFRPVIELTSGGVWNEPQPCLRQARMRNPGKSSTFLESKGLRQLPRYRRVLDLRIVHQQKRLTEN